MKKFFIVAILGCTCLQAVNLKLVQSIYISDFEEAEKIIVKMMRGGYDDRLEAAIAGAYVAKCKQNLGEKEMYEWMIHRMLAPTLYGDTNDTEMPK